MYIMEEKKSLLLGVCGSPRKQGTEYAIQYALNYAAEKFDFDVEFWTVRKKEINFCLHCDYCIREKQGCVSKDDMEALFPKLESARFFLFGTPVFQGNLSGQLKTVLDRCRALIAKNHNVFKNKIGAALAVGGIEVEDRKLQLEVYLIFTSKIKYVLFLEEHLGQI